MFVLLSWPFRKQKRRRNRFAKRNGDDNDIRDGLLYSVWRSDTEFGSLASVGSFDQQQWRQHADELRAAASAHFHVDSFQTFVHYS